MGWRGGDVSLSLCNPLLQFLLEEECEWRLVPELQMIEAAELRLKHALQ